MEGRGPDLDDSDAHTHAEDDAQVLLQPALHLLHAALRAENTATSPHDGPHHPNTQDHRGWGPPPAQRSGRAGSGWSSDGPTDEHKDEGANDKQRNQRKAGTALQRKVDGAVAQVRPGAGGSESTAPRASPPATTHAPPGTPASPRGCCRSGSCCRRVPRRSPSAATQGRPPHRSSCRNRGR